MFQFWRRGHRLIGVIACLFLFGIAVTGFLLALKREISWMRPSEVPAEPVASASELVSMETVMNSVWELKMKELQSMKDVDRVDYRPKPNVFKVVSKQGYKEVQVDGGTGKVLNVADRNDTLIESLHDMSWFHEAVRTYWTPVIAASLATLSASGLYMYVNPILRRRAFHRSQKSNKKV